MLNRSIYQIFETAAPLLILWVAIFFVITAVRIVLSLRKPHQQLKTNNLVSELPGIPLTLLHTVAFVKALMLGDLISGVLFLWWGPGFIVIALIYLISHVRKKKINWAPIALITSYTCKVNYVLFMLVYFHFGMPAIMFTFSAWIISDQISLAWFSNNADRTRRTFEDFWLFRIFYLGLLFTPVFYASMPYRIPCMIFGIVLFAVWMVSIIKVYRQGLLLKRPVGYEYLRNIVYLSSRYTKKR